MHNSHPEPPEFGVSKELGLDKSCLGMSERGVSALCSIILNHPQSGWDLSRNIHVNRSSHAY